jgi:S1-C subfamily serine protease
VQGLIDHGHQSGAPELLDQALMLLEGVVADPEVRPDEVEEAWGLIGRVHKQFYVSAALAGGEPRKEAMESALAAYSKGWDASENLWHGINLVALLSRAEEDGLEVESPHEARALAEEIRMRVEERIDDAKADLWDYATAMEASLALGDTEAAISLAETYVKLGLEKGRDEFEFASTARQLREVWGLDPEGPAGSAILPLLEAVVLDRGLRTSEGSGSVQLETASVVKMQSAGTFERLERVFGSDSFVTTRWLQLLFGRLRAIGSVSTRSGRGVGTGFMVRGPTLSAELDDDWYFVTNCHVVTDDEAVIERAPPHHKPCRPQDVRITFELLFEEEPRDYGVAQVVWSSPPEECDVSILRLDGPFYEDQVEPYPVTPHLADPSTRPRLYIAGHPGGGSLQVSMHDNHLIELNDSHLQYRTPTNPGSSGSPVFNDEWDLVAVHHAGSPEMERLDGSGEVHEANQGVRLSAITVALDEFLRERRAG